MLVECPKYSGSGKTTLRGQTTQKPMLHRPVSAFVTIDFPYHLKQFVLHGLRNQENPEPTFISTTSKGADPISYFLQTSFRRPKGDQIMPELDHSHQDRLRIKLSSRLVNDHRIFLSAEAQKCFLNTVKKEFKKKFREFLELRSAQGGIVVQSIRLFLEDHDIDYSDKLFESLSRDFYRYLASQEEQAA